MHDEDATALRELIGDVRDEIKEEIGALRVTVQESIVRHEPCYRTVMGNGRSGVETRLTIIEERDATRVRIGKVALTVIGILAGIIGSVATIVFKWIKGA